MSTMRAAALILAAMAFLAGCESTERARTPAQAAAKAACDRHFAGKGLSEYQKAQACICLQRVARSTFTADELRAMKDESPRQKFQRRINQVGRAIYSNVRAKRECGYSFARAELIPKLDTVLRTCKQENNPADCQCVYTELRKRLSPRAIEAVGPNPPLDMSEAEATQIGKDIKRFYGEVTEACTTLTG